MLISPFKRILIDNLQQNPVTLLRSWPGPSLVPGVQDALRQNWGMDQLGFTHGGNDNKGIGHTTPYTRRTNFSHIELF